MKKWLKEGFWEDAREETDGEAKGGGGIQRPATGSDRDGLILQADDEVE